jgi:hypothetical protein
MIAIVYFFYFFVFPFFCVEGLFKTTFPVPTTTKFHYEFSKVSFEQGVRRIHSLEHFTKRVYNPIYTLFQIRKTSRVAQVGQWTGIEIECLIGCEKYVLLMCSRTRTESHLLFFKKQKEYLNMTLRVEESVMGHKLEINLSGCPILKRMLVQSYLWCTSICDDHLFWVYDFEADENLAQYRRKVLLR